MLHIMIRIVSIFIGSMGSMKTEKFKTSKFELFLTIIIGLFVSIALCILLYNLLKTSIVFIILLFPFIAVIRKLNNKLVIENGKLRLENFTEIKEISLENVAQIVLEEKETANSDGSRMIIHYMNVLDQAGHSIFTFSSGYIGNEEEEKRFINAIQAINPNIIISFKSSTAKH